MDHRRHLLELANIVICAGEMNEVALIATSRTVAEYFGPLGLFRVRPAMRWVCRHVHGSPPWESLFRQVLES